jgi:Transposase DDE domain
MIRLVLTDFWLGWRLSFRASKRFGPMEQVRGWDLAEWCRAEGNWDLEVVKRTPGVRGFSVQPRRWVVERSFGWLSRNRRLSKDYERNRLH